MSSALAQVTDGHLSPIGVRLPPGLSYDDWCSLGFQLCRFHEAANWAIGDWLFYGEWEYGRRYEDALELTGLGYQTLADLKYVAGRFDLSRRHEKLSFAHHREVAALPPADADRLLAEAESNGWSRNRVREEVAAARQPKRLEQSDPGSEAAVPLAVVVQFVIAREQEQRWQSAAAAEGKSLSEWVASVCEAAA